MYEATKVNRDSLPLNKQQTVTLVKLVYHDKPLQ